MQRLLEGGLKRGKLTEKKGNQVHERLRAEPQLGAAVATADIVIEAIVEDLAIKQRLFADVERAAPPGALLATNTSSLSIGQIAAAMTQPARLVGMHFFNPVHVMKIGRAHV